MLPSIVLPKTASAATLAVIWMVNGLLDPASVPRSQVSTCPLMLLGGRSAETKVSLSGRVTVRVTPLAGMMPRLPYRRICTTVSPGKADFRHRSIHPQVRIS